MTTLELWFVMILCILYSRIAANEPSFMSMQLKILDQRHKQKLNLKALDAVLFGPPLRKYECIRNKLQTLALMKGKRTHAVLIACFLFMNSSNAWILYSPLSTNLLVLCRSAA